MKTVSDTIWRALILMEKPQTLDSIQEDNHMNIYLLANGSGCDGHTSLLWLRAVAKDNENG